MAFRVGRSAAGSSSLRRGERMVHRDPASLLGIPLEHREIDHPQRPPALLHELQILADLRRSAPSASLTTLALSAPKKIRSLSAAPVRSECP